MSAAIAGNDVAMIVESMFSMNRATAMMRGTRRSWLMEEAAGGLSSAVLRQRTLQNAHASLHEMRATRPEGSMIYILAALLPPLGLLLNAQPFSAMLNVILIGFSLIFGILFFAPVLFLLPSLHGVLAVHMKREDRKHREIVEAIERHGPPP